MRRISYPTPKAPGKNAILYAQMLTADRLDAGLLYETGGWILMAGTAGENEWFVLCDNGETTTERTFNKAWEAADCLMNLAAYAEAG